MQFIHNGQWTILVIDCFQDLECPFVIAIKRIFYSYFITSIVWTNQLTLVPSLKQCISNVE